MKVSQPNVIPSILHILHRLMMLLFSMKMILFYFLVASDFEIAKSQPSVENCPGSSMGWASSKEDQARQFWESADYGYVEKAKQKLRTYCTAQRKGDSTLQCIDHLRYCYATGIFLDFRKSALNEGYDKYREDVLGPGQIGGRCQLNSQMLKSEPQHKSPLQSWYAEMEHYTSLDFSPLKDTQHCDIIVQRPTILLKLDAGINMYHHFCDFVNLYVSQHINGSFDQDINIVLWDTSAMPYGDFFSVTWKAFTKHPTIQLKEWDGKRVCIKEVMFSLPARMFYGLYYNMPLIPGCVGSSLIRDFSRHVLHGLDIPQPRPTQNVRVTLLSRETKHRNIINEQELLTALRQENDLLIKHVVYDWRTMPFLEQLKHTVESDIFIGMHGSGLTHTLFQPDWGVLFELYNCDDSECYKDLARLRGTRYITWSNSNKLKAKDSGSHPQTGEAHAKFTDYSFDVREFLRLVRRAVDFVQKNKLYKEKVRSRTEL